jgi:hypothetical protein
MWSSPGLGHSNDPANRALLHSTNLLDNPNPGWSIVDGGFVDHLVLF